MPQLSAQLAIAVVAGRFPAVHLAAAAAAVAGCFLAVRVATAAEDQMPVYRVLPAHPQL